jgi:hypothetical protein
VAVLPAVDAARDAAGLALARPHLSRLVDSITASREILQGMLAAVLVPAARLILLALFVLLGLAFGRVLLIPPLAIAAWLVLNQVEALGLARERGADAGRWQVPALGAAALARALPGLLLSLGVTWGARAWAGLPLAGLQSLATVQLFLAGQALLYQGRTRVPRPGRELLAFSGLQLVLVIGLAGLGIFLAPLPWAWLLGVAAANGLVFAGLEYFRSGPWVGSLLSGREEKSGGRA